jgi:hypothetical protein
VDERKPLVLGRGAGTAATAGTAAAMSCVVLEVDHAPADPDLAERGGAVWVGASSLGN